VDLDHSGIVHTGPEVVEIIHQKIRASIVAGFTIHMSVIEPDPTLITLADTLEGRIKQDGLFVSAVRQGWPRSGR
jgi:hypothetical protein